MTYTPTDLINDVIRELNLAVPVAALGKPDQLAEVCLAGIKSLKSAPKSVVVAVYEHKHGQDVRVFKDVAAAAKWKEKIATEDWEDMLETPAPDDPTERADAYFDQMANHGNPEFFVIHDEEVEG